MVQVLVVYINIEYLDLLGHTEEPSGPQNPKALNPEAQTLNLESSTVRASIQTLCYRLQTLSLGKFIVSMSTGSNLVKSHPPPLPSPPRNLLEKVKA